MPCREARSRTIVSPLFSAFASENVVGSSSIRPASIFDRSRMSLMSESRCFPEERMSSRYSFCFSFTSPKMPCDSTSENPMTALSGVRSSWLMFARNSLLWRFAAPRPLRLALVSVDQRPVREELALVAVRDLELMALRLDLVEQTHVQDGDRRLIGERLGELEVVRGEWPDLDTPEDERAEHRALAPDGDAEHGARPRRFDRRRQHGELGLLLDIGDVLRLAGRDEPAHERARRQRGRRWREAVGELRES